MKPTGLKYDTKHSKKSGSRFEPGLYPAHVVGLRTYEYNGSFVFNTTVKIADEVKDIKPEFKWIIGKEYSSRGIWLNPNPADGEEWRNKYYHQWFKECGVNFESADENGNLELSAVEEDDIYGHPVFAKFKEVSYKTKDGEDKKKVQVDAILPWEDGDRLSKAELESDVPF